MVELSTEPDQTSENKDVSMDLTLLNLLDDREIRFFRTAHLIFNISLIVIFSTFLLVLISFGFLFGEWILNINNYLSAQQNWILFIHSVLTVCCQTGLRWDVYYCSVGKKKLSNLSFNYQIFILLLVLEFVFITRVILVYCPMKGISFWIHILLIVFIIRFCAQILILTAINYSKRELEDKKLIKMIREGIDEKVENQSIDKNEIQKSEEQTE